MYKVERSVTDVIDGYCCRTTLLTNLRTVIHFSPVAVLKCCTDITWWIPSSSFKMLYRHHLMDSSLESATNITFHFLRLHHIRHILIYIWLVHRPDISGVKRTCRANMPDSHSRGQSDLFIVNVKHLGVRNWKHWSMVNQEQ